MCAALALVLAPAAGVAQGTTGAVQQRSDPGMLMSERAYRRFEGIAHLYGDGRYGEALSSAESFLRSELNDYERAMGEQMLGYTLVALDRPAEAVPRFERALELDALPNSTHFSMMRSLAQLHASLEQWQKSLDTMTRYLRFLPEATAEDRIMMAQNYVQLRRYGEALDWVRGAIERAGDGARESWLQLELAILLELKDHPAALRLLNTMVARWPDRLRYWETMAGLHQEMDQDKAALAALMTAYDAGLITEQSKLMNLARMNLYVELPYQAGRILERAMEAGHIEAGPVQLELLLHSWTTAREFDRAARVIDRLAPITGDGDLLIRKARLAMEQNRWQEALDAAREALELGKVSQPGAAWLVIGIALMELDRLRESRQAFQRAQEFEPDARRQAREWQRFVEERIQVAELRAGH